MNSTRPKEIDAIATAFSFPKLRSVAITCKELLQYHDEPQGGAQELEEEPDNQLLLQVLEESTPGTVASGSMKGKKQKRTHDSNVEGDVAHTSKKQKGGNKEFMRWAGDECEENNTNAESSHPFKELIPVGGTSEVDVGSHVKHCNSVHEGKFLNGKLARMAAQNKDQDDRAGGANLTELQGKQARASIDAINRPAAVEHPSPSNHNYDELKETNRNLKEIVTCMKNIEANMRKLVEEKENKVDELNSSQELTSGCPSAQSVEIFSHQQEAQHPHEIIPQKVQDMAREASSHTKAIRILTKELFTQKELTTCTITGRSKNGGKRQLDPQRVNLISVFMKTHFNTEAPEVKRVIGDKCRESGRRR